LTRDSDARTRRDLRDQDYATGFEPSGSGRHAGEDLLPNRAYPSNLLWRLTKALDPQALPGRILDLGPTNNTNIQFWAEAGFDVTCHDLFASESRRIADLASMSPLTLAGDSVRKLRLPYDADSFSAVCAWNVLARLPFVLAQQYARECHRVLCPSGLLHAIFLDADGRPDTRRQYEIVDRQTLQVSSVAVPRPLPTSWIDAEIRLLMSRFGACEIQGTPAHTREALAQREPITGTR
jgi:SAM-dependent methyltransferase